MDIINHIVTWVLTPETLTFLASSIFALFREKGKNKDLKAESEVKKIAMNEIKRVDSKVMPKEAKKDTVRKAMLSIAEDKKLEKYLSEEKVEEIIESIYHGYVKNGLIK